MTTAIDIDNTLASTVTRLISLMNEKFKRRWAMQHVKSYSIEESLGLTTVQREYMCQLFHDPAFYRGLRPIYKAVEGVQRISDTDDIFYVSSRPRSTADATMEWLSDNNFPVGLVEVGLQDKASAIAVERCEALVEDCGEQALQVATLLSIPVYLFDCPWNRQFKDPSLTRVHGWQEIIAMLDEE